MVKLLSNRQNFVYTQLKKWIYLFRLNRDIIQFL